MNTMWAAAMAGLVNGLMGGGGGMILLPLLLREGKVRGKEAFATCLAIMLPLGALSAAVCLFTRRPPMELVLPALAGGTLGGLLGGHFFQRVPAAYLRKGFGLLLLYAGGRFLLC